MAQRDYAARSGIKKKKQNKSNKPILLVLALIILSSFVAALFFLKQQAPEVPVEAPAVAEQKQPKSVLPNRPEEVWSYIKALETRTVPVDDKTSGVDKNTQLNDEQKKVLLAMEKEQKQAEERRKIPNSVPLNEPTSVDSAESNKKNTAPETAKVDAKKADAVKKAENAPTETATAASNKKYGLQCGTFKDRKNAENLQARLIMLGLNARVNTSGEWNRVQVGPVGDRAATVKAQEQAKSVTGCVIIGM